jgi:hypothetical protein
MCFLIPSSLLILSLVSLTISSATNTNSPTAASYKLNKQNQCGSPYGSWEQILPDTCVPVLNSGYQILDVRGPWPLCANGTEAKAAFFWPGSNNCDPSDGRMIEPLSTKKEVMGVCTFLALVGSFSFWCDGPPIIAPVRILGSKSFLLWTVS